MSLIISGIVKEVGGNSKNSQGVDKRIEYVFDGLDPVAEYQTLNGQYTNYYRGANRHITTSQHFNSGATGQLSWYHYNNKGDVAGMTKHNGNSVHTYRYDPYGGVIPANGNFTDPHNHYTLTGKEFDENMGLVWFGARFYDPESGVWMGQDSYRGRLSDPGSLHRFGYVGNNPVSLWDWYGFSDSILNADVKTCLINNSFLNAITPVNGCYSKNKKLSLQGDLKALSGELYCLTDSRDIGVGACLGSKKIKKISKGKVNLAPLCLSVGSDDITIGASLEVLGQGGDISISGKAVKKKTEEAIDTVKNPAKVAAELEPWSPGIFSYLRLLLTGKSFP
ncbi:MAG: RHS repeat-associated core domain-containing protein [Candidatus Electrothrix sp. AR1]|nr:RHS repeat-associated core domain-containing protein [Candidatus Electrothrix sp. AR1]